MPAVRPTTTILPLLLALVACGGGGGGGAPLRNPPKIVLADVDVPAGQTSGVLELGIVAEDEGPAMLQADVITDPARIRLGNGVTAVADVRDLDAGLVEPGRLRIVFGDATSKTAAATLPNGALLRIPFEVVAGAPAGAVEVRVEQVIGSDTDGLEEAVDPAPTTAEITLH